MTVRGAADVAFLLYGGYDVLGDVTQIADSHEALIEETHALGDAWRKQAFVGVAQSEITQDGFYNDAVNGVHERLSTGPGVAQVLCYGAAGTATGAEFVGYSGMQVNYKRMVSRGALHKAQATYRGSGKVDTGKILWTHKALTATSATNSGSIDNTVSSTRGGAGYFQLSNFAGAVNATAVLARVQHSSDNITFADLISFTAATAAPAAQRSELGSTVVVERYVRMATSYQGGAAPASAAMFVGFARY